MKLFAFIGVSGSGKSSIQHSLPMRFLTHYTTRSVRAGEIDGYHVKHVSFQEMALLESNQKLATLTGYAGNYYATPIEFVFDILEDSIPYHATATVESIKQFKELLGEDNVVVFYIKPQNVEVLKERMIARGDSEEDIEKRIRHIYSENELANEEFADYVIINDILENSVLEAKDYIAKELDIDSLDKLGEIL